MLLVSGQKDVNNLKHFALYHKLNKWEISPIAASLGIMVHQLAVYNKYKPQFNLKTGAKYSFRLNKLQFAFLLRLEYV